LAYSEDNVLGWIQSQGLFAGVKRVLAAVSGGADSTAMAAVLHRLSADGRLGAELVLGHVNHGLRGAASDGDAAFVHALGERLGVRVVSRRVDVRGFASAQRLSIETAGRVLRIGALAEMARACGCDAVATGHHGDDQAETVVHRLMRGTGLRGLCGIRPATTLEGVRFIRPMLGLRRAEIEVYCRANHVAWRDDASNRSTAFTRNRIRHQLLPALETQMPTLAERFTTLAEVCRAAQERIETAMESATVKLTLNRQQNVVTIGRATFCGQSPWVQAALLGKAVEAVGGGLRDVTSRHYQTLMANAAAAGNTQTTWPGNLAVQVEDDKIVLLKHTADGTALPAEAAAVEIGKSVIFGPYTVKTTLLSRTATLSEDALRDKPAMTERLDADCIEGPLILRRLEPGDRFWPMGLGSKKKVARFLLDAKIDKAARKSIFVLADARKILWLAPLRLDERAKITPQTLQLIEIRIEKAIV
jgi:tRNA(Ile)-lysidine synthase